MNCNIGNIKWWYLIYHPEREKVVINGNIIYCDSFKGNQDPYIWNNEFLYSFCHITQLKDLYKDKDYIYFFVSSESYKKIYENKKLYLDTVFYINKKLTWNNKNHIYLKDKIIPSYNRKKCFDNHFSWVNFDKWYQHKFNKRKYRYTLYWDEYKSFLITKSNKMLNIFNYVKNIIKSDIKDNNFMSWNGTKPIYLNWKETMALYKKLYNFSLDNNYTVLRWKELQSIWKCNLNKFKKWKCN